MKISRIRNAVFWTTFIPQLLIAVQLILAYVNQYVYPIGFSITEDMITGFMAVVNAVLLVLATLGIVIDPTTKGIKDSKIESKEPK